MNELGSIFGIESVFGVCFGVILSPVIGFFFIVQRCFKCDSLTIHKFFGCLMVDVWLLVSVFSMVIKSFVISLF